MAKLSLRFLQIFMALLLLASATGKLFDLQGYAAVLRTYELLPQAAIMPTAIAMPLLELFLSLWIFSGIKLEFSALAALLLHVVFTVVTVVSNLRELDIPNCGCFGIYWARPMTWGTVVENLILTMVCVFIFLLAGRRRKAL